MLQRVSFRNFKGFRHVDVGLERLTAIVGPNGSGKTSILEGIHSLSQLRRHKPNIVFEGKNDPSLVFSRNAPGEMELSFSSSWGEFRLRYAPAEDVFLIGPHSPHEGWEFWSEERGLHDEDIDWRPCDSSSMTHFPIGEASLLQLDALRLASPSFSKSIHPVLDKKGRGLASALAFMALNQPDNFQEIQTRLRDVIPSVERIRFDRVTTHSHVSETIRIDEDNLTRHKKVERVSDRLIFDFRGAPNLPAHLASEGTLLVLGLLTILMEPFSPGLLLLDDLDHGLHPKAQRDVVGLLRKILAENPGLQIVMTTHSPYLLDNLRPEEVRLTTLNDDGSAACAPLIAHPDFDRWKGEMSPGEMWSLFGEEWVASQPVKG